ncbi:MAG: hypothetical protein HY553_15870, partial [Elusimicrobia bacterium]|nr:hypothetical protein [Elusimicrobiota bacterium]
IGFPGEEDSDLNQSLDLAMELLEKNKNAIINQLSPLTPLPGTELLRDAIAKYGFKEPERLEEWIRITRGRQERPWLDAKALRKIRFLYYTSLFLCSAERYAQKFHIPALVFSLYSWTIWQRWKRRWYWLDWEIPFMRLLFRWFINPVDYTFPKDYGDAHTAKESDIVPVRALTSLDSSVTH